MAAGVAEGYCDEVGLHERAFAQFGGSCENLLYDRIRTVFRGEGFPVVQPVKV